MSKQTALPVSQTQLALSSELVTSARAWRKTADQALSGFGISSSAALPLLMIGRLGDEGVRQVTLAHAVGIEGPSLVRVLDQLCATQLARRDEDPADGRAKIVSLTQSGRDLVGQIETRLNALRQRVLKDVTAAELEITLRVMRRFSEGIYETTPEIAHEAVHEAVQKTGPTSRATRAASHPASLD
jgi:MarR family transcriptional regulator for hemolysin